MTIKDHYHSFSMFDSISGGRLSDQQAKDLGLPLVERGVKWTISTKCGDGKECQAAEAWPDYGKADFSINERHLKFTKWPQKQIIDLEKSKLDL